MHDFSRERGAGVLTSKNHQGGLADSEDHSDGKIFSRPGSSRCPVETIQSYLSHLSPECSSLFQKARNQCKKFVCFLPSPLTFELFYRITFMPIRLDVSRGPIFFQVLVYSCRPIVASVRQVVVRSQSAVLSKIWAN